MRSTRVPAHRPHLCTILRLALFGLLALTPAGPVVAQTTAATTRTEAAAPAKKPLTVDEYGLWRTIRDERISGDGRWVAYTLRQMNVLPIDEKPVLILRNVETDREIEVPNAHSPEFSPDSRWVVYQVDSVRARPGRGRGAPAGAPADTGATATADSAAAQQDSASARPTPSPPRVELRELASGRTRSWQRMQAAGFNTRSTHLLVRSRSGSGGGRGGRGGGGASAANGTDAVLHDLRSGHSQFLGSVGDIAFSRQGDLLAFAVDASMRDANGLFVMDLEGARTHVLDNDSLTYARIAWSDDGNGLAALKGRDVEKKRERDNVLIAFRALRESLDDPERMPARLDRTTAERFPDGFVVSERAPVSWSEDGRRVFFGIIPQTEEDTARRPGTDSVPDVDIWHSADDRIQSVQMRRANADRNFTFLQAFDVVRSRFIPLADSAMKEVDLSADGRWAVGADVRAWVSDYERSAADLYRVDTTTGERTLFLEKQLTGQYLPGFSPDGRHYLYWKDDSFHAYELEKGTTKTLPGTPDGSFADMEWDYVGPRPPYGVTGWTPDGRGVIVEHRYDLWLLPVDGGAPARNLTGGAGDRDEVRFRYVRTEAIDSAAPRRTRTGDEIDLAKPVTLSAYGEYTKKNGFYRLANGRLTELVYEDARFGNPVRAERAERWLLTRETFEEYPDLRVAGADFRDSRKISDANPQQAEYVWGRNILFDYTNRDGVRLQGVLTLPDDYVEGERRPMIVSFYEKNSQNLHRYRSPSFLTGMGSLPVEALSRGYITMLADVHFRTGNSHSDMLESVEAATRKVIELGYADPDHIGVHGHSYGGEGAAFIGTRSKMFAAVGMGAGVTDLYTDFSQNWGWSYQIDGGSGNNGSGYYLYSQGRWGFSPWDDPGKYRFESAITHAPDAVAPFLIMHGTADPTVSFNEGLKFYNALRYNGKEAILLAYPGEGHGLRGLANRRDLTKRYFEFFDHHLRGAEAPDWMTQGVPYLVKQANRGR